MTQEEVYTQEHVALLGDYKEPWCGQPALLSALLSAAAMYKASELSERFLAPAWIVANHSRWPVPSSEHGWRAGRCSWTAMTPAATACMTRSAG